MIKRIQALNYRCLKYVDQQLDSFHLLVGPNATGKTTFLDVIAMLHDIVDNGPSNSLVGRTNDYKDLFFARKGPKFEIALEVKIPDSRREKIEKPEMDMVRYEISLGTAKESVDFVILSERLFFLNSQANIGIVDQNQLELFPEPNSPPDTILSPKSVPGTKAIINKVKGGNDNFYPETKVAKGKRWAHSFKLGPLKSALGNIPDDEEQFPVATWFRDFLSNGIQSFILNSSLMKKASPPTKTKGFLTDGSNLPWVVKRLKQSKPKAYESWIKHLQTAFPDIKEIRPIEREDDRHCFLMLDYNDGLHIPSWMASDGTLRLLALTLPAFISEFDGVYLIEEPENGIHPKAVETVFQSLSSVYGAQILLATHSPILLSLIDAKKISQVLCFAKTEGGGTAIVSGDKHPKLSNWRGDPNISLLFAGGVLG